MRLTYWARFVMLCHFTTFTRVCLMAVLTFQAECSHRVEPQKRAMNSLTHCHLQHGADQAGTDALLTGMQTVCPNTLSHLPPMQDNA